MNGTLALAVFNLATVVGQVLIGYYCDIGPYTAVMIGTSAVSAVLAYALWGFAHSLALVYVFAVMFGGIVRDFSLSRIRIADQGPSLERRFQLYMACSGVRGRTYVRSYNP